MKNLAPTKSNLMKCKDELKFAKLGYDLLDQKRNILILELMNLVEKAEVSRKNLDAVFALAYQALEDAVLKIGKLKLFSASAAINISSSIRIQSRKVMGVSLPIVNTDFKESSPYFSFTDTPYHVDEAIVHFKKVLQSLGEFAELKISITRLAKEVKKTIRKVNALEKIVIPDLQESVIHITNRLEEAERENLILMKTIKERLEKGKNESEEEVDRVVVKEIEPWRREWA